MRTFRIKRGLCISFPSFLFALLLFTAPASVLPYPADAVYIPARDYFSTLTSEINKARSSIVAVVYLYALYPGQPKAQTTQLTAALVAARKRGCAVRVVLDKGGSSPENGQDAVNANNRAAYEYLRSQGVDACFADVPAVMHAKAVIIDSATVITGSVNWSEAGFLKNTEASTLIRSREVAASALNELGAIHGISVQDRDTTAARLSVQFLKDTLLLGRMVSFQDEQIFDLYLYLLRLGYASPESTMVLDYKPLIHYLGLDSLTNKAAREYIKRDLGILQDRFKLIQATTHPGKDADVRLVAIAGEYLAVPSGYFKWGWNRQLDFSGKVMEMLNLYYSSTSFTRPSWSLTVSTIAAWHGISKPFVWAGTQALRRKNLIEVQYFELPQDKSEQRHPNVYMPLSLYDPAALEAVWQKLEAKYGREKTARGRGYASAVFKDCDAGAVEKLIVLENQFGIDKMQSASKIISAFEANNPKRNLEYFFGIIRKGE